MRGLLILILLAFATPGAADPIKMKDYLAGLPTNKADARVLYGTEPSQFIDVYVPKTPSKGRRPVIILIHGGCWQAEVPAQALTGVAEKLTATGAVVWNIEYRRLGNPGGGYPGMYLDVAAAVDKLRTEADRFNVDLDRVIAVGHSAGGHLALWAASRHKIAASSALHADNPVRIRTVVDLSGAGDLKELADLLPWICGPDVKMAQIVGEKTPQRPDPFADTSPRALLPTGVRTVSLHGEFDDYLPPFVGYWWKTAARKAGDVSEYRTLPNAAHFDPVAIQTPTWPLVQAAITAEVAALKPAKR